MKYMAQIRLTAGRREMRIESASGDLTRRVEFHDGDDYHAALARLGLRSFGRHYDIDDDGEVFMVRVDPNYEDLYTGNFTVALDLFHHQVVVWIQDKRVPFFDEEAAGEAATALKRAAVEARERWG